MAEDVEMLDIAMEEDDMEIDDGMANECWSYHIHRPQFMPWLIYHQCENACSLFAIANAFEIKLRERNLLHTSLSRDQLVDRFTPPTNEEEIFKSLMTLGVTTDDCYPNGNVGEIPIFRITGYRALNIHRPSDIFNEVCNNGPVVMVLKIYEEFVNLRSGDIYKGQGNPLSIAGQPYVGATHLVCVLGGSYDTNNEPFYYFSKFCGYQFRGKRDREDIVEGACCR